MLLFPLAGLRFSRQRGDWEGELDSHQRARSLAHHFFGDAAEQKAAQSAMALGKTG
jgi:hypothetical protein